MGEFTESLTVRILGDSSGFQSELGRVGDAVRSFQSELDGLLNFDQSLSDSFGRLGDSAVTPLLNVSRILSGIQQQVNQLSGSTITLNVSPAVGALNLLSRMIASVRAQLAALNAVSFAAPRVPIAPPVVGGRGPIRQFASGGFVDGARGVDQVPSMLTAGEFVVRKPVVDQVGKTFFDVLNRSGDAAASDVGVHKNLSRSETNSNSTTNNYGEISIHVSDSNDVNRVMRDLRFEGHRLRNRRG